jgi:hypothetical protein
MTPEFWILMGLSGLALGTICIPVNASGDAKAWMRYGQYQFVLGTGKLMIIVAIEWAVRKSIPVLLSQHE